MNSLSVKKLKELAKEFRVDISGLRKKTDIVEKLESHHNKLKKFMNYTYIRQLGREGKDGKTFLAKHNENGKKYAIKIFNDKKSEKRIEYEVKLQQKAAKSGISVPVFDWDSNGKFVSMTVLDKTLFDLFVEQDYQLSIDQQKDVIDILKKLDSEGIFHADPNPLNFMYKKNKLYMIDFGFSKLINKKSIEKNGNTPNMKYMPTGLIIHLRKINPKSKLKYLDKFSLLKK